MQKNKVTDVDPFAVYSEKDLNRFILNPPHPEGKCNCCGKSFNNLKPFPHDHALLVKNFRTYCPHDEEVEKAVDNFFRNCETEVDLEKAREKLIGKYGKKKAAEMEGIYYMAGCVMASWECSECFFLDPYEFDEKFWDTCRKIVNEPEFLGEVKLSD